MELSSRYWKQALLSLVACLGLLSAHTAAAAGALQIEQRATGAVVGTWVLTLPNGSTQIHSREKMQEVPLSQNGTYQLRITPPSGAITTVNVYDDSTKIQSVTGTQVSMELDAATAYRLIVNYAYDGIIRVDSEPRGVQFNLVSPYDITLSGVTPAVFYDLPPQSFIVQFAPIEGCTAPKPQRRTSENEVAFFGRYNCDVVQKEEPVTEPVVNEEANQGRVTIDLSVNTQESLPGGTVLYTIHVTNHDKRTQHDLSVGFSFDPTVMAIIDTLPDKGSLINESAAVWSIYELYAGRTWSVTFPVHMDSGNTAGTTAQATARVAGQGVNVAQSTLSDTAIVGIAVLPATGGRFDVLFLGISALLAAGSAAVLWRKRAAVAALAA